MQNQRLESGRIGLTRGGKNGLFMLSFNPEMGEKMSKENYFHAIAEAEKRFGLEGQPSWRHLKGRDHNTLFGKHRTNEKTQRKSMALARDLEIELDTEYKKATTQLTLSFPDKKNKLQKLEKS